MGDGEMASVAAFLVALGRTARRYLDQLGARSMQWMCRMQIANCIICAAGLAMNLALSVRNILRGFDILRGRRWSTAASLVNVVYQLYSNWDIILTALKRRML